LRKNENLTQANDDTFTDFRIDMIFNGYPDAYFLRYCDKAGIPAFIVFNVRMADTFRDNFANPRRGDYFDGRADFRRLFDNPCADRTVAAAVGRIVMPSK